MPYAISGPDVMNTKKWLQDLAFLISRFVHRSELYIMQTFRSEVETLWGFKFKDSGVWLRERWLTAV